jgi:hypothetical protein
MLSRSIGTITILATKILDQSTRDIEATGEGRHPGRSAISGVSIDCGKRISACQGNQSPWLAFISSTMSLSPSHDVIKSDRLSEVRHRRKVPGCREQMRQAWNCKGIFSTSPFGRSERTEPWTHCFEVRAVLGHPPPDRPALFWR